MTTERVMSFPSGVPLTLIGREILIGGAPFTDGGGWLVIPHSPELQSSFSDGDLRVRLAARREENGDHGLYVDAVRLRDREFASMHTFALREGAGWIRYIPDRVKRAAEAHISMYVDTHPVWPDRRIEV